MESKKSLSIIKIGGNIIDDAIELSHFLSDFSMIEGKLFLSLGDFFLLGFLCIFKPSVELIEFFETL